MAKAKTNGEAAVARRSDNDESAAQEINLDMMSRTLVGIQDQIKFADAKATFIAGLNVLLFGFVVANADKLANTPPVARSWAFYTAWVLLFGYGVGALGSIIHIIMTLIPRFGDLAPQSRTHFGHILNQYGKDYAKYCNAVKTMTACDWADDIGSQIVEISHIALTKHRYVRRAAIWTLSALGFWVAGWVAVIAAH